MNRFSPWLHFGAMAGLALLTLWAAAVAEEHHGDAGWWGAWIVYAAVVAPWLLYVVVRAAVEHALRSVGEKRP